MQEYEYLIFMYISDSIVIYLRNCALDKDQCYVSYADDFIEKRVYSIVTFFFFQ